MRALILLAVLAAGCATTNPSGPLPIGQPINVCPVKHIRVCDGAGAAKYCYCERGF